MAEHNRAEIIQEALGRLRRAAGQMARPLQFMEVCGTHTMSAFRCGLHSLMPDNVTLLSGPGCPVCVTAQGDIDLFIDLASNHDVTLCTYGDMLRVPGQLGSLEEARSKGRDIRIIYSAGDAIKIAQKNPARQVVFAAVGFETTTAPTAAALSIAEKLKLDNFTLLVSHKLVMPALRALLEGGQVNLDGFLLPGHVSVIIGAQAYRPVVEHYHQRAVIVGFEDFQMVQALALLAEQVQKDEVRLENLYPQAVSETGNQTAWKMIQEYFEPVDMDWRGLGRLPQSGLALKKRYEHFDAMQRFGLQVHATEEPAGCRCGEVISGLMTPRDCNLFATTCTPVHPIGPCMVSSEGTCQAWFKYRRQPSEPAANSPEVQRN